MRILMIGSARNIHVAKWAKQIVNSGIELHFYDSIPCHELHTEFPSGMYIHGRSVRTSNIPSNIITPGAMNWKISFGNNTITNLFNLVRARCDESDCLQNVIKKVKPDIIHAMELQHSGFLFYNTKSKLGDRMPPSIISILGSDIYLFSKIPNEKEKIPKVLSSFDYLLCECQRDIKLANENGFKGEALPIMHPSGGIDSDLLENISRGIKMPSRRHAIAVKGYQNWAGRGLFILRALKECADDIRQFKIKVYSAPPDVQLAVDVLRYDSGLDIQVLPNLASNEFLEFLSTCRLSIAASISDGVPGVFLEAMAVGTFPIQSFTAAADEWVKDGKTGILVDPEDSVEIAEAIRRACTDDLLVDNAFPINKKQIINRYDLSKTRELIVSCYNKVQRFNK